MKHEFPPEYSHDRSQYLLGYLLEDLAAATIDDKGDGDASNDEVVPALARVAVFDFMAKYDGTGDRHLLASYAYQWQRVGQIVVANLWEDTFAEAKSPVVARKAGDLSLLLWLGCEATSLDIGSIV